MESASHVEKLERKNRSDVKSIGKKLESIAQMEERNKQYVVSLVLAGDWLTTSPGLYRLEEENQKLRDKVEQLKKSERELKDIIDGLHVYGRE